MRLRFITRGSLLGLLALTPAAAVAQTAAPPAPAAEPAAPPAPATTADATQARLDEIDQRSRIIERKLEIAEETSATRAKEAPLLTAGERGFSITSADKGYQVRIRGLIQADGRAYFDDPALRQRTPAPHTFLVRKARPIIDASFANVADFRLMVDFVSPAAPIQDAYVDFRPFTFLKLRAGKFKSPVSLERLQGDPVVKFAERALTSSVAPNRDIGAMLHGDLFGGAITYAFGVFDGAGDGASVDADANYAKDLVGRLFLQPFKSDPHHVLSGLGFGVAATTGNQKGTTAASGLAGYASPGQLNFFNYLTDTRDANNNVFARKRRSRVAPQLYYFAGPFGLLAEYVVAQHTVEKRGTRKELVNAAWLAQGSWVLTGDANSYEGVTPQAPFDLAAGNIGALELSVRYHELDIDDETFPTYADPASAASRARAWGAALFWYWTRTLAWQFTFEQTRFKGGAANGGNRTTENVFIGRGQISF